MSTMMLIIIAAGIAVPLPVIWIYRSIVIGRPDEWVLRIRNGKLVKAGVGIYFIRMPWERVVRFTAAIQRVSFAADVLTGEKVRASVEGFILWSVSSEDDGPFKAFSKLGIQNRIDVSDPIDRERKHILSNSQYRAFQHMLNAVVERYAGRYSLNDLLTDQDPFIKHLLAEVRRITEYMGVKIDDVQVLQIRPGDPEILKRISAPFEEAARETAVKARLETEERIKQIEIETSTQIEEKRLQAERDQRIEKARTALEVEQQRAQLLESEFEARRLVLEQRHRILSIQSQHEHERNVILESNKTALQEAVLARKEMAFKAAMARKQRMAETTGLTIQAINRAEEGKSPAVREHELAGLITTKLAEALSNLPLKDAHWITVGEQSPAQILALVITACRTLIDSGRPRPH